MQSTTNYSMNLVEGTDLVNIPVQLNPNFQTVDAEMFKNKQAGIGTATEVVTGTVHAVVRSNTDADMFRFTATGAWTAGDTMTLDGSAVTVHLADGTAPATGAYIIGAEVVAVVNGTLVTLLTSAAQPVAGVTSFNSRTGAVVPTASDYDAADIDYDNTLSGLTATDCQSALDEVVSMIPSGSGSWVHEGTHTGGSADTISIPSGVKEIFVNIYSNIYVSFEYFLLKEVTTLDTVYRKSFYTSASAYSNGDLQLASGAIACANSGIRTNGGAIGGTIDVYFKY